MLIQYLRFIPKSISSGSRVNPNWNILNQQFTSRSAHHDDGLRVFLDHILAAGWYLEDNLEPTLAHPEALAMIKNVLRKVPEDARFLQLLNKVPIEKTNRSIYTLFLTEKDGCLFSEWDDNGTVSRCHFESSRSLRCVDHIRSHLGHRPFSCTGAENCSVCDKEYVDILEKGRLLSQRIY